MCIGCMCITVLTVTHAINMYLYGPLQQPKGAQSAVTTIVKDIAEGKTNKKWHIKGKIKCHNTTGCK